MKSNVIGSIRALARAVGRSPSTCSEWVKRSDWRWEPEPPWHSTIVPAVLAWAAELQPDRAKHAQKPVPFASVKNIITPDYLQNPESPFYLLPKIGEERYRAMSVGDLDELSRYLSGAIWNIAYDLLPAGEGLLREAAADYYAAIVDRIFSERAEAAAEALSKTLAGWMNDRFTAAKTTKPRTK